MEIVDAVKLLGKMSIRRKIIFSSFFVVIVLLTVLFLVYKLILFGGFVRIEHEIMQQNIDRTRKTLAEEIAVLNAKSADWAIWSDSYEFMATGDEAFLKSNISASAFTSFKLNFIIFLNPDGEIFYGEGYDLKHQRPIPVSEGLRRYIFKGGPLAKNPNIQSSLSGVLMLAEEPVLISSRPIVTSEGEGPSRGTLIFARYLNDSAIHDIGQTLRLKLSMFRLDRALSADNVAMVERVRASNKEFTVYPENSEHIFGYTIINDIFGKPALLLKIDSQREIFVHGVTTLLYLSVVILFACFLVGLGAFLLFKNELAKQVRYQARLKTLNECFLSFGTDPLKNINHLVKFSVEILGANFAFYNHIENGKVFTSGQWQTPEDLLFLDAPGSLCSDILWQDGDAVKVYRNLPQSPYARTDPNVARYHLQMCLGKAVKIGTRQAGALFVMSEQDLAPDEEDRGFLSIIAVAIGIEEIRRSVEQSFKASEERFRKIATTVTDFIYTVHLKDGRPTTTTYGPTCVSVTGYTPEEFELNKVLWIAMVPEQDRTKVQEQLNLALAGQEPDPIEYRIIRKDSVVRWVNSCLILQKNLQGKIVALEGALADITRQKQAEEELRQVMAIKGEFVSMVSHELRTPLTAIKEGIGIVLDGSAGELNGDQKDFLSTAKRNVDRLARLINDVLDYQKLDAGRMAFDIKGHDLNSLVEDVVKTMTPVARDKKLELQTRLEELPPIEFDHDRITQVLINLVNNAIKFTDQGSVTVVTKRGDNIITVSVVDTGIGIKEEDTRNLFVTFSQLAVGKDRKTGGTGLGLVISKKIIQQHGGKIWVESQFGCGSVFSFCLPILERRS